MATKKNNKLYGFSTESPVIVSSIPASLDFMRSLVSTNKFHILFHRKGSLVTQNSKPIDHYEIMTTDNQYFDIYISAYGKKDLFIPPQGFLFDSLHSFDLQDYKINKKYFLDDDWGDLSDELLRYIQTVPLLERFLGESIGTNSRLKKFPFDLIDKLIENKTLMPIPKDLDFKTLIKARKK